MAVMLNTRDPVQGLEDYVGDIKPYHTKVLEVWIEYIYNDAVKASVRDKVDHLINVELNRFHKHCAHGFASLPWGLLINGQDPQELDVPELVYGNNQTTSRNAVYQQFYEYVRRTNTTRNRDYVPSKPTSAGPNGEYDLIVHQSLWDEAKSFFAGIMFSSDYWYDSYRSTLYRKDGDKWIEVDFHLAPFPPQDTSTNLWINTTLMHLFIRNGKKWDRYFDLAVTNHSTMIFPPSWRSNWDLSDCWGFGENFVSTFVTESIKFRMFDKHNTNVRVGVYDPTNDQAHMYDQNTMVRVDYPIHIRTERTYDPVTGRYLYHDYEDSIVTNPSRTDARTIALDGAEFLGFNVRREYKGVRISPYKVWKMGTNGPTMSYESPIGQSTYEFQVTGDAIEVISNGSVIQSPFNDGDVVYVTSTDDLPSYYSAEREEQRTRPANQELKLPVQDRVAADGTILIVGSRSRSANVAPKLMRYTPYRVVMLSSTKIGLLELEQDEVTVPRQMGTMQCVPLIDKGYGKHYIGYGVPVPFIQTEPPNDSTGVAVGATISETVTIRYL